MSRQGTVPVYINNFNWLTTTRALAGFFAAMPRTDVIIVDNGSTYPPLLDWYRHCPFRVVKLGCNVGSHAPWTCGAVLPPAVHAAYYGSRYYVVTDSDLSFDECPADLLDLLIDGHEEYPDVTKVGVSLEIDDIPGDTIVGLEAVAWERQFWAERRDDRFFNAAIDTTCAVYAPGIPGRGSHLRSDRPYTARHMPWYIATHNATAEQRYFAATTTRGAWGPRLRAVLARAELPSTAAVLSPLALELPEETRARFAPDWAISRELERLLCLLLDSYRPRDILETGTGLSSLLIWHYRRAVSSARSLHLEQRGKYGEEMRQHAAQLNVAPGSISLCELSAGYYDLNGVPLERGRKFDLLLLDGPASSAARANMPALRFILGSSSADSIIIQDDTHRAPEASVVTALQKHFGAHHHHHFEVVDSMFPWRRSVALLPRHRCSNPAALAEQVDGVHWRGG